MEQNDAPRHGGPSLYPLSGRLILGPHLHAWMLDALPRMTAPLRFCSAFMRSEAINPLLELLPVGVTGRALVRWRFEDVLKGASDLEVYELCKRHGISLYMRQQFHGKVYALPPIGIGTGSANATQAGFGILSHSNDEVCNLVPSSLENLALIDEFFIGATLIDDELIDLLRQAVDASCSTDNAGSWPEEVLRKLNPEPPPPRLLVDQCLWSDGAWFVHSRMPSTEAEQHDSVLLGLAPGASMIDVYRALERNAALCWFRNQLESADSAEMYFGQISQYLHSALLDDPGMHRSQVKAILQNLLSWIGLCRLPGFIIDRPRHSQRIRLTFQ